METKDIIKSRRLELGYTLDDIARMVGVSGATVSRWESGDIANMRRDKISKLAEALQVSPSVIMGLEETNEEVGTIAAHHDSEGWTREELEEIEEFKRYVLSKRKKVY